MPSFGIGMKVGMRTIISSAGPGRWNYACECGREGTATNAALRKAKSCGCLQRAVAARTKTKHGHTTRKNGSTRTYRIWMGMLTRCRNPNFAQWADYGGRGISVCPRWEQYANFLVDMGECPPRLTIERINNNGNYEPGNCRWASRQEQAANTRTSAYVEFNGERKTLSQWSRLSGVSAHTIGDRIRCGWDAGSAIHTPARRGNNQFNMGRGVAQ